MLPALFGHAGEEHSSAAESASHFLSSAPNAIMVWVLASVVVFFILPKLIKQFDKAGVLLVFGALNLFYGLFLYNKSPTLGAIILSVGFASTLWTVISGLGLADMQQKGKKNVRRKR